MGCVSLQLLLMSCNLEQREAKEIAAARNVRSLTSDLLRSFPDNKGGRGDDLHACSLT